MISDEELGEIKHSPKKRTSDIAQLEDEEYDTDYDDGEDDYDDDGDYRRKRSSDKKSIRNIKHQILVLRSLHFLQVRLFWLLQSSLSAKQPVSLAVTAVQTLRRQDRIPMLRQMKTEWWLFRIW